MSLVLRRVPADSPAAEPAEPSGRDRARGAWNGIDSLGARADHSPRSIQILRAMNQSIWMRSPRRSSIRSPAPGDRFEPLGMGGRSTPLADFLRGRRVPRGRRAHQPLLCDQRGIIWVVGQRIADRVKITPQTKRTVELRWIQEE